MSAAAPEAHVSVENLTKHFRAGGLLGSTGSGRTVRAVDGVSLTIARGEALGLVGESGSGKSTLGRAVLRLHEPTSGRVVIGDVDVTALAPAPLRRFRKRAQMIAQDPGGSLDPRFSVEQIVAEPLRVHRVVEARAAIRDEVARLLARVGLGAELAARRPRELSGGQRQRVAIARALAVRPEFIVADEPLSALDVSVQAQIVNLIVSLRASERLTWLLVSHDLRVVRHLCDRVAVLYLGRVVEEASAARVLGEPRHPYTQALLSAVPVLDRDGERAPRILLDGEIPSPANPPSGCAFHPRCPLYAKRDRPAVCRDERPLLDERGASGHRVACHFAGDV
jgi:peptide/nickel transport system ATP-binding protein/oligopeptide transport system ATP-binding protein